jgi:hypothetical protein
MMKIKVPKYLIAISAGFISINANAATSVLSITVGGTVYPQPYWTVNGTQGTAAVYTFNNTVISGSSISSSANLLKLVTSDPKQGDIALVTPSGCTVGNTNISNSNVVFMADQSYTGNASIRFSVFGTGTGQSTAINFTNISPTASGNVACTTGGSLTYTY